MQKPLLSHELSEDDPTYSRSQEAGVALLHVADLVSLRLTRLLRRFGLSMATFNILRILRRAGEPLACAEVAKRMITPAPDITRLIARLEKQGMVERTRRPADKRLVLVGITLSGLETLKQLDAPVSSLHKRVMTPLKKSQRKQMLATLATLAAGMSDG